LARTNYQHGKRLRELAKKQKREEKEQKRKERKEAGGLVNLEEGAAAEASLEDGDAIAPPPDEVAPAADSKA
jgi:hypothetical protein